MNFQAPTDSDTAQKTKNWLSVVKTVATPLRNAHLLRTRLLQLRRQAAVTAAQKVAKQLQVARYSLPPNCNGGVML